MAISARSSLGPTPGPDSKTGVGAGADAGVGTATEADRKQRQTASPTRHALRTGGWPLVRVGWANVETVVACASTAQARQQTAWVCGRARSAGLGFRAADHLTQQAVA